MSAESEHLAFEIFAKLPAGSHLARNTAGKWYVNVSPRVPMMQWQRFDGETAYEAICDAANWYADYKRQLDDRSEA